MTKETKETKEKARETREKVRGEARERILAAAGELIAEHGVKGVSVRSINAAAGVSAGILHYHFGSLDKVVDALLERHMIPLMEERMQLLQALQAQPTVTVRAVVEFLVMPLARKIINDADEGLRYIRFLARLNYDRSPETVRIFERYFGPNVTQLTALLQRAAPGIPQEVFRLRLIASSHAMLHTLAGLESGARPTPTDAATSKQSLWERVEFLIEYLCGGLSADTSFRNTDKARESAA